MKIDNKIVVLGLAGLGVLGYLYYKRKISGTSISEESYDDGLGGGGSFGMPMGTPYANPIVINQPIVKDKSKKKAKAENESKTALASPPSVASTPISSSTPSPTSTNTTSGSAVASISGRVAPPTINRVGGSVSVIDKPTDVQYRYRNGVPTTSTPLSSSFMDFDGNEDVKRSALDIELDVD